jgi:hypothetical protein
MGIPPVSLGAIGQASADPSAPQMQQAQAATPPPQQQPQQQAPPQQQQDDDPIHQQLMQKAQEALNAKTGVKQILQNFFSGLSHGMVPPSMTPQFQQEKALANLNQYESTKALAGLRDQQAESMKEVPLYKLDGTPVLRSDGSPVTLPNMHAGPWYQAQAAAAGRAQVQGQKNEGALDVQDLKNKGQQDIHPIQGLMNDAVSALNSGDTATYQNKLQQLQQLGGASTAQARADKYEQFKSTQQYNIWKTNQDNQTRTNIAAMNAGKAPAAMMQTASFAQSGLNRLNDAQAAMQRLEARGVLGNVASNKIEDWIFGKGLVDPTLPAQDKEDIGRLRAAASYTSSAAMRAHTGRTSREIYDDFKNTMGINQGPDAWKGAMQETRSMLGDYANGATNAAIQKLRGGAAPNTPSSGGSSGRRVIDLTK